VAVSTPVATAVDAVTVTDRVCLDVGAGHGDSTAALLAADAANVYSVDSDPGRVAALADRFDDRCTPILADLRALPLGADSVDVCLAHAVCNQVTPAGLWTLATELARVATADATLVVDDYTPLPADAAVADLFALEDATACLATGAPAQTFYPPGLVAAVFEAHGWRPAGDRVLLDPVPWTGPHLDAHRGAIREGAATLVPTLHRGVTAALDAVVSTSDRAGSMYSRRFTRRD